MSSPPRLPSILGAHLHDISAEPARASNSGAAAAPTQSPSNALLALLERRAQTTPHSTSTGVLQPAALPSEVESLLKLYKKRQKTEQLLLDIFAEDVATPAKAAWVRLDKIFYDEAEPDEQAANLILDTRTAAETFVGTAQKLYSQLRRTYENSDIEKEIEKVLLGAADNAEAKINDFVKLTEFITYSRETLNAIQTSILPLFDGRYILKEDAPTKTLLKNLNELEEKQIFAKARSFISNLKKDPEESDEIDEYFARFFEPNLVNVLVSTAQLRTRIQFAVENRVVNDMRDTLNELGASVAPQEESETLLLKLEPKLTETLGHARQVLRYAADQMSELDRAMKHSAATDQSRRSAKTEIEHIKSVQVAVLIGMVRTLTLTLMNVRTIDAGHSPAQEDTSWQQDIRERTERLSADVCSCYDGTAGLTFYLSNAKAPPDIRLDVMELVAETMSSVATDLERIEAGLRSSGNNEQTGAVVHQLSEIITELGTSLTGQINDATAELELSRGKVRRSKPFERKAAEDRIKRALQFAADHLNSFSVKPYEEPEPAADVESAPLPADSDGQASNEAQPETPAATMVSEVGGTGDPGDPGDSDDEFDAISRRLDTLETDVLPKHRADLTSARTSARTVIAAMNEQLVRPGEKPMSPHSIWLSVMLVSSQCKTASAELQKWADELKLDAKFLKTKRAGRHRDFSDLKNRFSSIKQATDALLAALREKESELSEEAQSMRLARSATMFPLRPTYSGFKFLFGNNCIHRIEKHTYTPQNGNDYGVEFVIYLNTPDKLQELGCAPAEQYRALVHYHFPWHGKHKNKPTFCHFKRPEQRHSTTSNSKEEVYSHEVPTDTATALFKQLNAIATTP